MLKGVLKKDHIVLKDSVDDWKEAVKFSVTPLEKNGIVPEDYKDKIIESVNELGPYIFIAPNIALPHVQYFEKTDVGMSLLKLNHQVTYDEDHYAQLFFTFSGKDGTSHISLIQELAIFLSDEKNVNALINMTTSDEIFHYIEQNVS